jgi:hypothetical protein
MESNESIQTEIESLYLILLLGKDKASKYIDPAINISQRSETFDYRHLHLLKKIKLLLLKELKTQSPSEVASKWNLPVKVVHLMANSKFKNANLFNILGLLSA